MNDKRHFMPDKSESRPYPGAFSPIEYWNSSITLLHLHSYYFELSQTQ